MTEIQHQYASIYDRLNEQPHLQDLIATPILQELDAQEDFAIYMHRTVPYQDLNIYNLESIIQNIGWDSDTYPGSFAAYILYVLKP